MVILLKLLIIGQRSDGPFLNPHGRSRLRSVQLWTRATFFLTIVVQLTDNYLYTCSMRIAHIINSPSYPLWVGVLSAPISAVLLVIIGIFATTSRTLGAGDYFDNMVFSITWDSIVVLFAFIINLHGLARTLSAKHVRWRGVAMLLCGTIVLVAAYWFYLAGPCYTALLLVWPKVCF